MVADELHDPREHDAVHSRIQRMQRELIAFGNRMDEPDPRVFRCKQLRVVGVEHVAKERRPGFMLVHDHIMAPETFCHDPVNT